jgi:putative aldouronate transport system permease protein
VDEKEMMLIKRPVKVGKSVDQSISLPGINPVARFLKGAWREIRKNWALMLMALPAVVVVFVICYMPMPGIILAFKNYKPGLGIWGSEWTGLKNFEFLFNSGIAWQIIRNTVFLNFLFIIAAQVCSLTMAFMMNEIYHKYIAKVFQSILFFPHFVSWVLVGYFTYAFLNADNGFVNSVLVKYGMASVNWYAQPTYWIPILVFLSVWKGLGYFTILYLAGMLGINPEYFEAARMDGANKLQEIWYINLPLIRPLVIINVLLAIGRIFYANFDFIWNVTRDTGMLLETTNVIDTYIYRSMAAIGNFNLAAAAGFFQAIAGFILVLLANWVVRKIDNEQALF